MYARRRGRRFSPRSSAGSSELQALEYYLARNLYSWIRADYRTLVDYGGGDVRVSAFPDKVALESEGAVAPNARSVSPAHALAQGTQALQVGAPAASAAFGGQLTCAFTAAQTYPSTIAAPNWNFCHDGTGSLLRLALAPSAGAGTVIYVGAGFGANTRYAIYRNSPTSLAWFAGNGANAVNANGGGSALTQDVASYVEADWLNGGGSPEYSLRRGTTLLTSGDVATPTTTDTSGTLALGSYSDGSLKSAFLFSDLMLAKSVSQALVTSVRRYMFIRYGLS